MDSVARALRPAHRWGAVNKQRAKAKPTSLVTS